LFGSSRADARAPGKLDFTLLANNFKPAGHRKIFPVGQFGVGRQLQCYNLPAAL
jgi:hypothetical protein